MRTHTRYELQDSTSIEEGPPVDQEGADSPHPGSLGSTAGPSRSISSESSDIPMPSAVALPPPAPAGASPSVLQRQQPLTKPPSPMDTEDENRSIVPAGDTATGARPTMERSCTS